MIMKKSDIEELVEKNKRSQITMVMVVVVPSTKKGWTETEARESLRGDGLVSSSFLSTTLST